MEELDENLTNEEIMNLLDSTDYDMSQLAEMTPEMQELFFKKIGRAFKKVGKKVGGGFKKFGKGFVKVAPKVLKVGEKVLDGAAKGAKIIQPFAGFVPIVGPGLSAAATGISTAHQAKQTVKSAVRI